MSPVEQLREKNAEIFRIQREIQASGKKLLVAQRQLAAIADELAINRFAGPVTKESGT